MELTHQDESWKVVTSNKKRKITLGTSAAGNLDTEKQRWLQELPLRNSFSSLTEEIDADPTSEITTHPTHIAKPPPIFIEAQIIDLLINLLKKYSREGQLHNKTNQNRTSKSPNKRARNF